MHTLKVLFVYFVIVFVRTFAAVFAFLAVCWTILGVCYAIGMWLQRRGNKKKA